MKWLINFLNRSGLYTRNQYLKVLDEKIAYLSYALELEQSIQGISDPKRPIVVFGSQVQIRDIELRHSQQIIVSPFSRNVHIERIYCQGTSNGN